jgi:ubiquinone/menaquinone biosynthesis C-methylase UbiE
MNERVQILDLGCGHTGLGRIAGSFACGIDVNFRALKRAMNNGPGLFVCGRGEQLPFRDNCFSFIRSNVAVPYMDIPAALAEMKRVLQPGGTIRLSLHPVSMTLKELLRAIRSGDLRNMVYRPYILINGVCFFWTSRLFRFPFNRRCESFQTMAGMRRVLRAHGFAEIQLEKSAQFIVTARKPEDSLAVSENCSDDVSVMAS